MSKKYQNMQILTSVNNIKLIGYPKSRKIYYFSLNVKYKKIKL